MTITVTHPVSQDIIVVIIHAAEATTGTHQATHGKTIITTDTANIVTATTATKLQKPRLNLK